MHIKKLSATSCLAILGCSFSTASIALEEVIVNGPTIRNEPFISARLGGGGSGGGFGGNGAGFGGGAVNRIAEEERKRLEEEKKEKEEKEKKECERAADVEYDQCDIAALEVFRIRISSCPDRSFTLRLDTPRGMNDVGFEYTNRDMQCVRDLEAQREVSRRRCINSRNANKRNC